MPQGELFIRTKRTLQLTSGAVGLITTRPTGWGTPESGDNGNGWVDAYLRYGLSLEKGARSKLLTPMPMKTPTNATSPSLNGVAFSGDAIGKTDKHEFSFDIHIVAPSESAFLDRYDLFCQEVLRGQYFQLRISKRPEDVRHLLYDGCEPFEEFKLEMAKFTLSVTEPHPEITQEYVSPFSHIS